MGALTAVWYEFKARNWELKSTKSIDLNSVEGILIWLNHTNLEVLRVLPRIILGFPMVSRFLFKEVNYNFIRPWLLNESRVFYNKFKYNRLNLLFLNFNRFFYKVINWRTVNCIFKVIVNNLVKNLKVTILFNFFYDRYNSICVLNLLNYLTINVGCYFQSIKSYYSNIFSRKFDVANIDFKSNYLSNAIQLNEFWVKMDNFKCVLILGSNLRMEVPNLNSNIRRYVFEKNYSVFLVGTLEFVTVSVINLGFSINTLCSVFRGRYLISKFFFNYFLLVFIGHIFYNNFRKFIDIYLKKRIKNMFFFVIQSFLGTIGAYELGLIDTTIDSSICDFNINYFVDSSDYNLNLKKKNNFNLYQGFKLTKSNKNVNLFLPSGSFLEQQTSYLNIYSEFIKGYKIHYAPKMARSHDAIFLYMIYLLLNGKHYLNNNFHGLQFFPIGDYYIYSFFFKLLCIKVYLDFKCFFLSGFKNMYMALNYDKKINNNKCLIKNICYYLYDTCFKFNNNNNNLDFVSISINHYK